MPSASRWGVLTSRSTTTKPTQDEAERWLRVYYSAVESGRQQGWKEGHRQGHREGWEQGYNARAGQDEVFAQLVADRLHMNGVRVEDRRKFIKTLIESMRAQEARQTHYERLDATHTGRE